jgi:hypothetical protein
LPKRSKMYCAWAEARDSSRHALVPDTWASAAPPAGYVFDVQIARPGDPFVDWKMGVTITSSSFTPDDGVGSYSFRARLRKPATGEGSQVLGCRSDHRRVTDVSSLISCPLGVGEAVVVGSGFRG